MTALLELHEVDAGYGEAQVLFNLSLRIGAGEVVSLLGRNGMGKTTAVRTIMGLIVPRGGAVRFRGDAIGGWAPERIARAGVALVPEGRQIFGNLSVRENLVAFADRRNGGAYWNLERVYGLFPRLAERAGNPGRSLSGGEQQMLAIGRALMTNPHLLILDEATEGLAPLIREEIWACLRRLREAGQSILVIDKYVKKLMELADHHVVIERGRAVWSGDSAALGAAPEVWSKYLTV